MNGRLLNVSFFVICGKKGDMITTGLYGRKIATGSIASVVILPIVPVEFGLKKIFTKLIYFL